MADLKCGDRQKLVESLALQGKSLVPAAQDRNALLQAVILGLYPELVCAAGDFPDLCRASKLVQGLETQMHKTIMTEYGHELAADSTWDGYIKAVAIHYNIGIVCYSADGKTSTHNCGPSNRATVEVGTYIRPSCRSPPRDALQYFEGVWQDVPLRGHKCVGDDGFSDAVNEFVEGAASALCDMNYTVQDEQLTALEQDVVAVFYSDARICSMLFQDGFEVTKMHDFIQRLGATPPRYLQVRADAPLPRVVGQAPQEPPAAAAVAAGTAGAPAATKGSVTANETSVLKAGEDSFRRSMDDYIHRMSDGKKLDPSEKKHWLLKAHSVLHREVEAIIKRTDRPAHWELRVRGTKVMLRSMKQTRQYLDGTD
ncbi:hypothetical protein HXX76_014147 [Chlamydomonas incerta]|uniref:Uncharacterized protein n=1 Tax=Chlamydomonas incerta TaxID=51695 RepID=A0A835SDJ5_CHLIN|nr:hypothetical protein HXX76_014147 [Chlamydomonas incerta]|eukprot:KAG2424989.1 hypothetical protein HXX76_014147 [Chlamydomonas incerta]